MWRSLKDTFDASTAVRYRQEWNQAEAVNLLAERKTMQPWKSIRCAGVRVCTVSAAMMIPLLVSTDVQADAVSWKTGPEFNRQLESLVGVSWTNSPLRDALHILSRHQHVAIYLDRRIDPDQRIDFSTQDVSLDTALHMLASQLRIGVCYFGPVVYFGPPEATDKLPTLAVLKSEELSNLPSEIRRGLARVETWQWDDLATPRDLIEQLAAASNVNVEGLDQIPHDLWPATQLPPLSWLDRLNLVLAGFDLTYEFSSDGTSLKLVNSPRVVALRRTYSVAGDSTQIANRLSAAVPAATVQAVGAQIDVVGSWKDHQSIQRILRGQPVRRPQPQSGLARYTLTVQNQPVGGIIRALADKLELTAKYDPRTTTKLNERVSFQVKDVTTEQLLDAVLSPAGLSFKLQGRTLEIVPAAD
jgi:hypothetical protein